MSVRRARGPRAGDRCYAVWSQIHGGNQGDELVIETVIDAIRARDAQARFVTISMAPDKSERRYGVPSVPIGSRPARSSEPRFIHGRSELVRLLWRRAMNVWHELVSLGRALRTARGFDTLVVAGSNPVMDDPGATYRMIKWITLTRLTGGRALILSTGVGPLERPLNCLLARATVRVANYVSVRDESSRELLRSIGSTKSIARVPDMGWAWEPLVERDRVEGDRRELRGEAATVGVNLMAVPYDTRGALGVVESEADWGDELRATFEAYLRATEELILHLTAGGHRILLFSSESGYDPMVQRELHASLVERHPELGRLIEVVADPREDAVDVLDHIDRCDVVVAARYHTALLSLGVGCPTVGVAYSRKTFDLFELLDLESMVIALEAVTGADLIALVERAMRVERDAVAVERRAEVRREVVAQFDELFGAVSSDSRSGD